MVPDIVAQSKGREVLLVFEKDIGDALIKAQAYDHEAEAIHLMRAAQTIRREMFENTYQFKGYFENSCQESSVPQTLLSLVSMILEGPDIQHQTHKEISRVKVALSLAQPLKFNSIKRSRPSATITQPQRTIKKMIPHSLYT